eukprot:scaffold45323_cov28-Tisochrysis_lutea.AAC.2
MSGQSASSRRSQGSSTSSLSSPPPGPSHGVGGDLPRPSAPNVASFPVTPGPSASFRLLALCNGILARNLGPAPLGGGGSSYVTRARWRCNREAPVPHANGGVSSMRPFAAELAAPATRPCIAELDAPAGVVASWLNLTTGGAGFVP